MKFIKLVQLVLILFQVATGQHVDKSEAFYANQQVRTIKQYQVK